MSVKQVRLFGITVENLWHVRVNGFVEDFVAKDKNGYRSQNNLLTKAELQEVATLIESGRT